MFLKNNQFVMSSGK